MADARHQKLDYFMFSKKLLVVAAWVAVSAASALATTTDCVREVQLKDVGNDEDPATATPSEGYSHTGTWPDVGATNRKGVLVQYSNSGSKRCITDVRLSDTQSPPDGFDEVGSWGTGPSGVWPSVYAAAQTGQRQVGLYIRRLPSGNSGLVYTKLLSWVRSTSKSPLSADYTYYSNLGSWDPGGSFDTRAQLWFPSPTLGKGAVTLMAKQGCHLEPGSGWESCEVIDYPGVAMVFSPKVTAKGKTALESVLSTVLSRMGTTYPVDLMRSYTVYVTNGETPAELNNLWVINGMHVPAREVGETELDTFLRDTLRGGAGTHRAWVSEGMTCKTGNRGYNPVAQGRNNELITANETKLANLPATSASTAQEIRTLATWLGSAASVGQEPHDADHVAAVAAKVKDYNAKVPSANANLAADSQLELLLAIDTSTRTFDHLVHEFTHGIDRRSGIRNEAGSAYPGSDPEALPIDVQEYFGVLHKAPAELPTDPNKKALIQKLFTGQATFDCDTLYR